MSKVVLAPVFTIKPDMFAQFVARVGQQRDDCLKLEPGCHHFDVLIADNEPNKVFLYEIYQDDTAIATHRDYEHYKRFKADTADMVVALDLKTWRIAD